MLLPLLVFVVVAGIDHRRLLRRRRTLPGMLAARRLDRRLRDVSTDARPIRTPPTTTTVVKHSARRAAAGARPAGRRAPAPARGWRG